MLRSALLSAVTLALVTALLAPAFGPSGDSVLCVGRDGHVEVEQLDAACCAAGVRRTAAAEPRPTTLERRVCPACTDLVIGTPSTLPPRSLTVAGLEAVDRTHPADSILDHDLSRQCRPAAWPHRTTGHSSTWMVVLLI